MKTLRAGEGIEAIHTFHAFDQVWTSGQLSEADLDRLGAQGFAAVINLAPPDHPDALAGEQNSYPLLNIKPDVIGAIAGHYHQLLRVGGGGGQVGNAGECFAR